MLVFEEDSHLTFMVWNLYFKFLFAKEKEPKHKQCRGSLWGNHQILITLFCKKNLEEFQIRPHDVHQVKS